MAARPSNTGGSMCGNCRCASTTGSTRWPWWLLCVTGYLIGAPIRLFYAAEAYQQYWFGWVRFIHFAAAFVYVFNFLARLYWGFVGNKYSSWRAFFPFKRSQRQEIVDVIKADVLKPRCTGPSPPGTTRWPA